jgi:adenylosuccinate synthase
MHCIAKIVRRNWTLTLKSDTELNLTKLDVLDSFPKIKIAVGYKDEQGAEMGFVREIIIPIFPSLIVP